MAKELDQPSKRICIGKIAGAHGVKGLVKIHPYCEDHALLEQAQDHKITIKSSAGKHLLGSVEGVHDRDAADALRNTELFITRDKLPEIEEDGAFYYEDLIGLKCVDESGTDIGKVIAVENYGAGDLLEIKPLSGHSFLIPYNDEFVPDVGETVTLKDYESFLP